MVHLVHIHLAHEGELFFRLALEDHLASRADLSGRR
jgi:hypothetical protein